MSEKLITIQATQSRRLLTAGYFGAIGCLMMLHTGISINRTLDLIDLFPTATPALYLVHGVSIITGLFGLFIIWMSIHSYRSTAESLYLTREGLFTSSGRKIFDIDNIARVGFGIGASKLSTWLLRPSNGFKIVLKEPMPRGLGLGLWVRFGTRVSLGPAISRKQGEAMSDRIKSLLVSEGFDETRDKTPLEIEGIISKALATLKVSQFRRLFGAVLFGGLGCFLMIITGLIINRGININHLLSMPEKITVYTISFIFGLSGILSLRASIRRYRTSDEILYLTHKSLLSSSDRKICDIDNIASMDAGGTQSNLSNGFSITLKEPMLSGSSLGLWTRRKTRVRLGPLISRKQSKAMSDMIKSLLTSEVP